MTNHVFLQKKILTINYLVIHQSVTNIETTEKMLLLKKKNAYFLIEECEIDPANLKKIDKEFITLNADDSVITEAIHLNTLEKHVVFEKNGQYFSRLKTVKITF